MQPELGIPIVLSVAFISVIAFIPLKIKRDELEVKKRTSNLVNKAEKEMKKDLEEFCEKRLKRVITYFPQGCHFEIERGYENRNKTLYIISPFKREGTIKYYYNVYLILEENSPEKITKKCKEILKTIKI